MRKTQQLQLCGMGWFKLHLGDFISNKDVIARWDGLILRRNSKPSKKYAHLYFHTPLSKEEVSQYSDVLRECNYLIIGTGYLGRMKVMSSALKYLLELGLEVNVKETPYALVEFSRRVANNEKACMIAHLTC